MSFNRDFFAYTFIAYGIKFSSLMEHGIYSRQFYLLSLCFSLDVTIPLRHVLKVYFPGNTIIIKKPINAVIYQLMIRLCLSLMPADNQGPCTQCRKRKISGSVCLSTAAPPLRKRRR